MDAFFERRLDTYDAHMLGEIEGAREFYPATAALLPRGDISGRCAFDDSDVFRKVFANEFFGCPDFFFTGCKISL